jgi:hypothetical protein
LSPYLFGSEENEILSAAPGAHHEVAVALGSPGGVLRGYIDVHRTPAAM